MGAGTLDLLCAPGPAADVQVHDLEREGRRAVLVDRSTGASADLDPPSTLIWRCLDGVSTLQEIVDDLVEVFDVPRERVSDDVLHLVHTLGEAGFLAGVRPAWADVPQEVA